MKKNNNTDLMIPILFASILSLSVMALAVPARASGAAIWTDQADYAPESFVTISGSGFTPYAVIAINVTDPLGAITTLSASANGTRAFSVSYQIDSLGGTYYVYATDGANSATTTFTDNTNVDTTTSLNAITSPLTAGQTGVSFSGMINGPSVYAAMPKLWYFTSCPTNDNQANGGGSFSSATNVATASAFSGAGYSGTFTAPAAGTYYFWAYYPGDSTGTSPNKVTFLPSYSSCRLVTVNPATSTYSITFDQSGIPTTGVTWGVTVGGTDHTGTGSSIPVTGLSGTNSYSYDTPVSGATGTRYVCSTGCTGSVSSAADSPVSATYTTQYAQTFEGSDPLITDATGTMVTLSPSGGSCDVSSIVVSGNAEGVAWCDAGTSLSFTFVNPLASTTPNTQYLLLSVDTTSPIAISGPNTVIGTYEAIPLNEALSGTCPLNVDSLGPNTFRLIFTPYSGSYKLTASNPGQLFYDIFVAGSGGSSYSVTLTLPSPFLTQGAVPVHVYSDVTVSGDCYIPSNEVTTEVSGTPGPTITVSGTIPASGLALIVVHVDYGAKGTYGYTYDSSNNAICTPGTCVTNVNDGTTYTFSVTGSLTSSQVLYNSNVFKNDPGFAGLVLDSNGNPVQGAQIVIKDSSGHALGTVYTDQDGWYNFYYKYTGRATIFYVTAAYGDWSSTQAVTLKANQLAQVIFTTS